MGSKLIEVAQTMDQAVSPWLLRQQPHIHGKTGLALDLACGAGRHSRYLSALGFQVIAVDRDSASFAELTRLNINCIQCDLEGSLKGYRWPFRDECFDLVVVTNYLHRPLFSSIFASIKLGGVLIYETFSDGHQNFGRPKNPHFLLKTDELLERCQAGSDSRGFQCLDFEQGQVNRNGPAIVQSICARRII
ncbi:class I SAM-dependent methyltransferase [Undibacterium cyanobacteriorum]|uniref:Class I SAM-dependent methyltransferase n=1 Tax=Undibacterium cyanobacteriorum TaxID=3073561 RepID=A0ABY9RFW4_9BURK|nr:class I SAM-dependent methyltransferase [Undibacterium sp. 20NA77.5]WMW79016.1 class I SAM-dependent methyltransferase [Undibacterium sp. 20NA77.5]